MSIVSPKSTQPPSFDYSAELPEGMTPKLLLEIYENLWCRHLALAEKMVADRPNITASELNAFSTGDERHEQLRLEAYSYVMKKESNDGLSVQLFMQKAYLTYISSQHLDGYTNGGAEFEKEFVEGTARFGKKLELLCTNQSS